MEKFIQTLKKSINYFKYIKMTKNTAAPITFANLFYQKILGINRHAYWPVHFTSKVTCPHNIRIGIGTAPGLSPHCYIQGINGIEIGNYTIIASGVGIISANHSIYEYTKHEKCRPIKIGKYCWIGMNAVILPGVHLGDHVVVAAGSVVNKSFPEGYCVLAGVPAKIVKTISKDKVVEKKNKYEFYGYIPKHLFKQ
ncbi:acyltransferase [Defluviitalea saccharophila]|uniref:Acyltransferase n=1 Tax=Defluviitalea saccharophila TaxID=879970 RepID=A0ABZ2Y0A7_9FIRM